MVDFANLLLAALLVGAMCGVWLLFRPKNLAGGFYIELHQHSVRTLNAPMPALGAATVIVTLVSAALSHANHQKFVLLLAAAISFAAGGLVTRLRNQPINTNVMTWHFEAPPSHWQRSRDAWWRWHVVRCVAGLVGLSLLLASILLRS